MEPLNLSVISNKPFCAKIILDDPSPTKLRPTCNGDVLADISKILLPNSCKSCPILSTPVSSLITILLLFIVTLVKPKIFIPIPPLKPLNNKEAIP